MKATFRTTAHGTGWSESLEIASGNFKNQQDVRKFATLVSKENGNIDVRWYCGNTVGLVLGNNNLFPIEGEI
jgi:hypothetical protein